MATAAQRLVEDGFQKAHRSDEMIGESPALKEVLRQVEVVAPTDATVLLQGETGTGKERLARAIHRLSARRGHSFVTVNCAAIPSGLLESELFGHERGAFTGAIAQKMGRFELAHQGTLLLDEIGDIPLELQPKLLRVLQEQAFDRLGSTRTQRVDVRLVAATNRDLVQLVDAGHFRADLYYRLNVFPLTIPPLRHRAEDIPLLVRHFVRHYARLLHKQIDVIPAEALDALTHYAWPGNVRELQNVIERAVILSPGPALGLARDELPQSRPPERSPALVRTLEAVERDHILRVLGETHGVIGGPQGAAARLGLRRTTLLYRMERLGYRAAAVVTACLTPSGTLCCTITVGELMGKPEDLIRYRANLQGEIDSTALYHTLAEVEAQPQLAAVYRRLAAVEEKHAQFWAQQLRDAGQPVPPPRPGW